MNKPFGTDDARLESYVRRLYQPEDEAQGDVRARAAAAGLPDIHVAALDGRHLEVLVRASGARKAVEIGTLAGYSGLCILRALPPEGVLHTFELDPLHAEVARETFRRAGLRARVELHLGSARETLPSIEGEGPFDLCFIDADKQGYPAYLDWAARNLRPGGLVLADNAFAFGGLAEPVGPSSPPEVRAMDEFHRRLAGSGEFRATVLPTGEGLALGVRI